jgi:hypothetical protein
VLKFGLFFLWQSISGSLSGQLGLPLLDGGALPAMDKLDCRDCADSSVSRFLLLLFKKLEE